MTALSPNITSRKADAHGELSVACRSEADTCCTTVQFSAKPFWIFDLDGTLTLPVHDFDYIRRELDVPSAADILGYLDSLTGAEASWRHCRLQEIEMDLARKAVPSPGAAEAVARLHQAGAQLGILTRNDRDIALLTLDTIGIGHYFASENVLGRNEAPPKPDPAGIHRLLSCWGAAPEDAVMVGDYLFDLQAGRAAGTATIQVGRPDGKSWPEFTDLALATLAELMIYFQ
ncbi:MAG: HAD family hydrolase [Desulfuromonadaceae bacterium]|nr:HAD family hydrolase [Desulfuromonadaceae bacterium]MDD2849611.1 HAD family hydrolase [Desulfuromonadaceae bacterium]MDD4130930.1 HAD family hydrolase [Desulfuromonadaceae bacterium]